MTTSSLRLGLVLPDDGGAGGDDTVDVTAQISNNFSALDGAVGLFECTAITRPVSGNYNGRLIIETDTGKIYRYSGGGWKYVCHDPTAQYAPAFETIAATLGPGFNNPVTLFRSGPLLKVNISHSSFAVNVPKDTAKLIATAPVGWRPAVNSFATLGAGNNGEGGEIIWYLDGTIIFYSHVTGGYLAGAAIYGQVSAFTAGYS